MSEVFSEGRIPVEMPLRGSVMADAQRDTRLACFLSRVRREIYNLDKENLYGMRANELSWWLLVART